MVTVSSAFISSRRERISLRVSSASGRAFKTTAGVDVLRVLGKTDLDNTDTVRTIPFTVSRTPNPGARGLYYACGVNGFNIPVMTFGRFHQLCLLLCLPAPVRVPAAG